MSEVDGCVQPSMGPVEADPKPAEREQEWPRERKSATMERARVGKAAPDFEASGYVAGEGFDNVRLSDYQGQWVVLCFYPGDFTFV